ncbi:MAG: hypothetical protein JWM68_1942 [Verrucomicrobiales bacterium]|nr:hypothetical protein [Verrucomicrobiales bacterium]
MSSTFKSLVRRLTMSSSERIRCEWVDAGKPLPPPHEIKQSILKDYAARFGLGTLVETGTFKGDMVFALRKSFQNIYSIELGQELFEQAKKRFASMNHVTILQGDSGEVLEKVLREINTPTLFWLDGHYSSGITARGDLDTPIVQELAHVARHPLREKHVLLVDDARCFVGKNNYPTLAGLQELCRKQGFSQFEVQDDIIRIHSWGEPVEKDLSRGL